MEKRYDFVIIMPTYNRRELLELELQQLVPAAESAGILVHHLIFDDCSTDLDYADMVALYRRDFYEIEYFRSPVRHGRVRFCSLYTKMMARIRTLDFAYAIAMVDDDIFVPDFFIRVADHFEARRRKDPSIVVMNLRWNARGRCWGQTRYIDCGFVCIREFFDAIEWKVPSRKKAVFRSSRTSTGVGMYMTKAMLKHPDYNAAEDDKVSFQRIRESHKGVKIQSVLRPWHTSWNLEKERHWGKTKSRVQMRQEAIQKRLAREARR